MAQPSSQASLNAYTRYDQLSGNAPVTLVLPGNQSSQFTIVWAVDDGEAGDGTSTITLTYF